MYNFYTKEVRKDRAHHGDGFNAILLGVIQNRLETSNSNKKMRRTKEEAPFEIPADDMHLLLCNEDDDDDDEEEEESEDESDEEVMDDNDSIAEF